MKLFAALALSVTIVSAGICNDKRPDCTNWARDNECMGDNAVRSHYPTALGHGPPTQLLGVVPTEIHGDRVPPVLRHLHTCLLYTSPSPRDGLLSRMPSSA